MGSFKDMQLHEFTSHSDAQKAYYETCFATSFCKPEPNNIVCFWLNEGLGKINIGFTHPNLYIHKLDDSQTKPNLPN